MRCDNLFFFRHIYILPLKKDFVPVRAKVLFLVFIGLYIYEFIHSPFLYALHLCCNYSHSMVLGGLEVMS